MSAQRQGHWAALFGRQTSFDMEIGRAKEISARWRPVDGSPHVDLILGFIPGHMAPGWGSDAHWIYIRRPEGIWKTRIREDIGDRRVMMCQDDGRGGVVGCSSLGARVASASGWHFERGGPWSAAERDSFVSGADLGIDAEIGDPLVDFVDTREPRSLVVAGEAFSHDRIDFSTQGGWLVGADRDTGRRVAWDLSTNRVAREQCLGQKLWLRFEGSWLRPVDVFVALGEQLKGAA